MSPSALQSTAQESFDQDFLDDVLAGLRQPQKTLPCKYFYNERGSQLFEKICTTPEYYVTRTECDIYESYAHEMSTFIGEHALIIEPGAGSVKKIGLLLKQLNNPAGFIPMDISEEILRESSAALARQFPDLDISPVVVDFLNQAELNRVFAPLSEEALVNKRVIFFPGSTIGNFRPAEAQQFLKQFSANLTPGDGLLIGVDLLKSVNVLENAYDDKAGVTADFNLNLLHRINNELEGDFPLEKFEHKAVFNQKESRIEMHIVSAELQKVQVADQVITFDKHETIHTENSYKYSIETFSEVARQAGFELRKVWSDEKDLFGVYYFEVI